MSIKSERVAKLIMNHLSTLLLTEVQDPRLEGVTVTDVKVDRELEHAQIFINALGEEERADEVLLGLESAKGFLRRRLADALTTRRTPELHFKWDNILKQADQIEQVLDSLNTEAEEELVEETDVADNPENEAMNDNE